MLKQLKIISLLLLINLSSFVFIVEVAAATYVGRSECVDCHKKEVEQWTGSHHDLAMQHADGSTVLGDFSDAVFNYAGITSKFYKKNEMFMVRTDGPDGKLHDYEIKYTFGVTPLQQYLIEIEDGRLQALSIAWDTREKSAGGQRWFHLYPDEKINYQDELHWTHTNFNWNSMCAECHSTDLQKNYDSKSATFQTTWSEIDVSCEACHGPASNHLNWAKTSVGREPANADRLKGFDFLLDERNDVSWLMDDKSVTAQRSHKRETEKEIEVCAQCHSRRSSITDNYHPGKPFADHYMPRLLDENMYFSDGQIQDEVYVYGSFLQSKMYHKGVTCSDCHEPHSLELRQQGNGVCLQCHAAEKFDSKKHHFHKADSKGALCVECHMPPRNYMVVDPRHDHSIRIPRPDLSVSLGTPNACNQCHEDKDVTWAATQVKKWYDKPGSGFQRYGHALDASRRDKTSAGKMLVEQINRIETPNIARATAIGALPPYLDQSTIKVIQKGLKDENTLVRLASISAVEEAPQAMRAQLVFPLIDDPVRSVRIEAARVLAAIPVGQLQGELREKYDRAMKDYVSSQMVNAERPEAQLNLGNYYAKKGNGTKAETAYKTAIKLEEMFVPAYINLADLYREQNNDTAAEQILTKAIKVQTESADAHYALGLLMIRQQHTDKAVHFLHRASGFDSNNAHYVYVYAVALNSTGKKDLAIDVLQDANLRFPQDTNILEALIAFHRDAGNDFAAQTFVRKRQKLE